VKRSYSEERRGRAILGDGTECVFDVYEAVLVWDGKKSLMEGYQLTVQVFDGGHVELIKVDTI
jgi:hypothetical protein